MKLLILGGGGIGSHLVEELCKSIDKGNRIVAIIGVQMLLNHLRGLNNKIINLSI